MRSPCPVGERGVLRGDARTPRAGLPETLLLLLLLLLAADAQGRDGAGLEPLGRDLLLALLADAEGAALDPSERLVDLREQELLPVAEAEDHRLRVLAGGLVDLVGEIVRVEARLLGEGLLRRHEELVLGLLEQRLEPLQVLLVQATLPSGAGAHRGAKKRAVKVKGPPRDVKLTRGSPCTAGRRLATTRFVA